MTDDVDALLGLVQAHQTEFWRLLEGTGTDAERDEALRVFIIEAWGLGYAKGLRKGAKALRDEVVRRVEARA